MSSEPASHDIAQVTVVRGGARAVDFDRAGGFTMDDQARLQATAWQLADRGAHVLLSASLTPGTLSLYDSPSFELFEVKAKRSINSDADKRGNVSELLIVVKQGR